MLLHAERNLFSPLTVKNSINIYCQGTYVHTHFAPGLSLNEDRCTTEAYEIDQLLLHYFQPKFQSSPSIKGSWSNVHKRGTPLSVHLHRSWAGTAGYGRPDTGQGVVVKKLTAHRGGSFLHCFLGIFHLEKVSVGGEDSNCPVVSRRHLRRFSLCVALDNDNGRGPAWSHSCCHVLSGSASRSGTSTCRPEVPARAVPQACRRHQACSAGGDAVLGLTDPSEAAFAGWRYSSAALSAWRVCSSFSTTVAPGVVSHHWGYKNDTKD